MKVYLVMLEYPYEGGTAEGVFSNKESAQKYIDANKDECSNRAEWYIVECEVQS